jgi:hypothetical protein
MSKVGFKIASMMLLIMVLVVSSVSAQSPLTNAQSGVQIANLSTTDATAIVTVYNQDGTVKATVSDQVISANGSKTYFPLENAPDATAPGLGIAGTLNGSIVVSADQNVAAISNILGTIGDYTVGASYGGASAGATTVVLPIISKNNSGFDTQFNVQNAGSSDVSVTVSFTPSQAGTACTLAAVTVKPGASTTFDQSTESCIGDKFVGSVTVTATGPVVASALQTGANSSTLLSYSGFSSGSSSLALPLINQNNSNFVTGISVQNLGSTDTEVTLSYSSPDAASCTETGTIPAGGAVTMGAHAKSFLGLTTTSTCTDGEKFVGAASVTANSADQPLVAVVNQLLVSSAGNAKAAAYNAFDPSAATSTVSFPLIMDNNNKFYTSYAISNVGTQATNVSCAYSASTVSPASKDLGSIAAGSGATVNQVGSEISTETYIGSATCTATGGDAKIVAIVNEFLPVAGDFLLVYEGFPVQ